ncbi:bifunctional HD family hydrolase/GNAT family N-acetyltransferase [Acinetobacter sp. ANC 3882]|uniref:bifunctional HD family hydrolase/N-acetyltransferase n=1 Tax=Acinetobacter sp. ANC 3882 TaxID=2923423 RepID=UPI001F4B6E6C|nr:bifunctional HD family hydrolase/GNAT family N-acetyltransferase [Acinetobacter sp. ANC 3882]MCH7313368.1 bifunctional HD family hydrolase/GNAT family N-acetyltransferase [Acinetobacter sp. ANC 3882]
MELDVIQNRLAFLREAEKLKNVIRFSHTSNGRQESTAEHSWRLCLMAMIFADQFKQIDFEKLLKMCLIHDLGEAIHGDIPAILKDQFPDKHQQEKQDLYQLTESLDEHPQTLIRTLWEEYENASTPEAKLVKALDKLETILQHNQGINPADFDYAFNLTYGEKYTNTSPLLKQIRSILNQETQEKIKMNILIRDENISDIQSIFTLTQAAFETVEHSSHTEQFIVNALRDSNQLTLSLVAIHNHKLVGHIAFSPVKISDGTTGWYGLGPVSVLPEYQSQGVGSKLIRTGIEALKDLDAVGCVLLGEPEYYDRFGFKADSRLRLADVPAEYFQVLPFTEHVPTGEVVYADAFHATA